jgi:hypothetical protein
MIRVRYSDGTVKQYKDVETAKFMVATEKFSSQGRIAPVEAADVMGITTGGVSVERELNITAGEIQFGWDA